MLNVGLEFAPGTSDDCKKLVGRMFSPGELLGMYREARQKYKTGDLVLVTAPDDDEITVWPRNEYVKDLRNRMGANGPKMMAVLTMAQKSAHQVVMLPFSSEAMWLVIVRTPEVPINVVIYATPYEVSSAGVS
jgi:hypothetical protein